MNTSPLISKGTKLTCPECDRALAIANKDIFSGDSFHSGQWDSIDDYVMINGTLCKCPCGVLYTRQLGVCFTQIHTEHGWVPGISQAAIEKINKISRSSKAIPFALIIVLITILLMVINR